MQFYAHNQLLIDYKFKTNAFIKMHHPCFNSQYFKSKAFNYIEQTGAEPKNFNGKTNQ